jgi:uncharacterized protein (TIGR02145 family)
LSNSEWENTINTEQGAWAYCNNDSSYACPFGKLYNWFACVDARQLCPTGWHVPSDSEWSELVNYIDPNNGYSGQYSFIAGASMKSAGTTLSGDGYWYYADWYNGFYCVCSAEDIGTNSVGFSGLPSGYRSYSGGYGQGYLGADDPTGNIGWLWSGIQDDSFISLCRVLSDYTTDIASEYRAAQSGFGVRCLRD